MFEKNKLSLCVALVLGVATSMPLYAQDSAEEQKAADSKLQQETKSAKKAKPSADDDLVVIPKSEDAIETLVVTGSLIPRSTFDGPDPMTVISEEDMKAKGLNTVAEVIDSLASNNGYREGSAGNLLSGMTIGASEANLRGLGAGRTLVLVNGRRIADYPMPFGGVMNGTDMATIPSAAMSRVEVLSGSASAIYGSDAVGGVINVITKRDMEQTIVTSNVGAFEDGYGFNSQTSFVTGKVFDRGSVTFGMEQFSQEPINGGEVDFLNDRKFLTTGVGLTHYDFAAGTVAPISPVGYVCEENDMVTTQTYSEDGKAQCNFDGSPGVNMQPEVDRTSVFVDGRYQLNDTISGYVTLLASKQEVQSSAPAGFWSGVIYNADGSEALQVARQFAPDLGFTTSAYDQEMWTLTTGLEGEITLGDSVWNWDLVYSGARFNMNQRHDAIREEVLRDWLVEGAQNSYALETDVLVVNNSFFENQLVNNLFRDASGDRAELMGQATTYAHSSADSISVKAVGELSDFGVLYNPVTVAVVGDFASQSTGINPDERSLNLDGNGWLRMNSVKAGGSRDRMGIGAEFLIPVVEDLELTFATRMDRYDDSSAIGGRNTSTLKFLYSPFDMLKFRGSYGQTFRAPDMFNIYGETTGTTTAADLVRNGCFADQDASDCTIYDVYYVRRGSTDLDEEKGRDLGLGFVLTPTNDISLAVDWYNVRLEDLVVTEDATGLVRAEWQCATGVIASDSRYCADVNSRIARNSSGIIEGVIVQAQNHEFTELEGIEVTLAGKHSSAKYGNFGAQFHYVNRLSHQWQQFAEDEVVEMRRGLAAQATPATNANLTLTWNNPLSGFRSVGGSLFIRRQGSVDNFAGTERMDPFYTANLTMNYTPSARLNLGLAIRNLTDEMPHLDETNQWPNYWSYLQQPYGRSFNLSFSYFLSE